MALKHVACDSIALMKTLNQSCKKVQTAAKRKGAVLTDPRAVNSVRLLDGAEIIWEEIPEQAGRSVASATESLGVVPNVQGRIQEGFSHFDFEFTDFGFGENVFEDEMGGTMVQEGEDEPVPVCTASGDARGCGECGWQEPS
ncbi:hypothetical protein M422DRAFT_54401 [Sphaerobolus stellatus SS14]|uniref:Uncharacterized protein n=1 Tax=Sphaerobolus stellatus (strain SS14) TaxID=990650 RepID=A0A0C9UV07_SPHS4|nr:hypothetical protein M422DRAFT_54401 [Sphaerobolus stellatus SS14]